jgi:peptidoglycan/LPS O-acetylase OafA/YrhL
MGLYRPEIDGLRAIAIISVILFHAGISLFSGGYVGVDIFFVISGFLITSIILKEQRDGRFSFWAFYERRARRILPAILFMLACITLLCFAFMLPRDLVEYGKILIYTILFGANFRLAGAPSYFAPSSHENPLLHMWSLAVEEQFYLVWPALLLLFLTFFSGKQTRYWISGLLVSSLAVSTLLVWLLPRSAFYHLPSRGWELLTGAALALGLVRPVKQRLIAEVLAAAGLALMILPMVTYGESTPFPGPAAIPPVLGCAMFIHAATFCETRIGSILKSGPLVFVGLISYSLYLWHWPLIALARYLSLRPLSPLDMAGLIGAAAVMSVISWRFIETPFRRHRAPIAEAWVKNTVRPGRLAYAALGIMAVFIGCGSFFQENKGSPWRLQPDVRAMVTQQMGFMRKGTCAERRALPSGLIECISPRRLKNEPDEFVRWGDSHAEHYFNGTVAALGHGRLLTRPGCSPLFGVSLVYESGKKLDETCAGAKQTALQRIKELKPKIVILAARWLAADKADYVWAERLHVFLKRDEDKTVSLQKTRENLAIGLVETIGQLKNMGMKVAVLGQVPELAYDVNKCIMLSNMFYGGDLSRCMILKRADVQTAQLAGLTIFSEIEKNNVDVYFYSPLKELCDEERCYAEKDGEILYFDQNHLNWAGSLYLANSIKSALSHSSTAEVRTVALQGVN